LDRKKLLFPFVPGESEHFGNINAEAKKLGRGIGKWKTGKNMLRGNSAREAGK